MKKSALDRVVFFRFAGARNAQPQFPKLQAQRLTSDAKQESSLLDESEKAFTAGQSANQEVATRNLGIIAKYKPRAASMIKAYCKGK